MDAHLFRRFCDALLPRLMGSRMEKIHALGAGVTEFSLYGGAFRDGKRCLVLKTDRKSPLLFTSSSHMPVHAQPPAFIMRLRKYLSGQRITHAICSWTERKLWLGFSGEAQLWLCLDLKEGPSLSFDTPPPFKEPLWPEHCSTLTALYQNSAESLTSSDAVPHDKQDWRAVITPALRRTLPFLDTLDADALLQDLQNGGGDIFLYESDGGHCEISAWPLPPQRLSAAEHWQEHIFDDPLAALEHAGKILVLDKLAQQARQNAAKPFSAEVSRLERLLKKLDSEYERLSDMQSRQHSALLLQSQLYRFGAQEKQASLTLQDEQGTHVITLNPRLTIRENMMQLFHQAGRGKRGLEHLSLRRAAVLEEKKKAEDSMLRTLAAMTGTGSLTTAVNSPKTQKQHALSAGELPRQVQAFRSSDGFLLLRGRDTKGNALALKLAAPHDYWLHTAEGPSAHVILRRNHAGQAVPDRTLQEAGMLAALKSWQKDQRTVLVQYSLAKYIHPMKKAAPGMVRIDKSEGTFSVHMEEDLEKRLSSV